MADLTAGTRVTALDFTPSVVVGDTTAISGISSTTPIAGSPEVSVTFMAPTTGRVLLVMTGALNNDGTNSTYVTAEIRENDSSGLQVMPPGGDRAVRNANADLITLSRLDVVHGLQPGGVYFARVLYRVGGGAAGAIQFRGISISPST